MIASIRTAPRAAVLPAVLAAALLAIPLATAPALASDWTVDQSASTLAFTARQNGSPLEGRFTDWSAEITFDPRALGEARIAASIGTASATTGQPQVDGTLPGASWFDAAAHPQARFVSSEIVAVGDGRFEASGTLTLKGIEMPLTLPFSLEIDGDTARAAAEVTLARTAYEVGTDVGTDTVADGVTVTLEIVATR